jgi:hypothetical protein
LAVYSQGELQKPSNVGDQLVLGANLPVGEMVDRVTALLNASQIYFKVCIALPGIQRD